MVGFSAKLVPIPHGGLYVVVPAPAAAAAQLKYGARVRGTVNGAPYRSSLMNYSGVYRMGVHLAVARAAGVVAGSRVKVTIAIDSKPLPTDAVPRDLARALRASAAASQTWKKLSPATRRGYVKSVIVAKRAETRDRRIAKIVGTLFYGVPPRAEWRPKS